MTSILVSGKCCCCCETRDAGACITISGGIAQCTQKTPCECASVNGIYTAPGFPCQQGPFLLKDIYACQPCPYGGTVSGTTCGVPLQYPPESLIITVSNATGDAVFFEGTHEVFYSGKADALLYYMESEEKVNVGYINTPSSPDLQSAFFAFVGIGCDGGAIAPVGPLLLPWIQFRSIRQEITVREDGWIDRVVRDTRHPAMPLPSQDGRVFCGEVAVIERAGAGTFYSLRTRASEGAEEFQVASGTINPGKFDVAVSLPLP